MREKLTPHSNAHLGLPSPPPFQSSCTRASSTHSVRFENADALLSAPSAGLINCRLTHSRSSLASRSAPCLCAASATIRRASHASSSDLRSAEHQDASNFALWRAGILGGAGHGIHAAMGTKDAASSQPREWLTENESVPPERDVADRRVALLGLCFR